VEITNAGQHFIYVLTASISVPLLTLWADKDAEVFAMIELTGC